VVGQLYTIGIDGVVKLDDTTGNSKYFPQARQLGWCPAVLDPQRQSDRLSSASAIPF
jgi:hypothetical protein